MSAAGCEESSVKPDYTEVYPPMSSCVFFSGVGAIKESINQARLQTFTQFSSNMEQRTHFKAEADWIREVMWQLQKTPETRSLYTT